MEVTISGRFNGPPGSANGGYSCGVTAQLLADGAAPNAAVEVTLRLPPPLDRPLRVEPGADERGDKVAICDGDDVVAEAREAELKLDIPNPISPDQARRAAERFDTRAYTEQHPFPRCFTCGPERTEGDGLRIFPGLPHDDRQLVAWPWTPDTSLADRATGLVDLPVVWAALDCPSGLARFTSDQADSQIDAVLGRMTTVVHRRPWPGELTVASGWPISDQGRRLLSGSALWSATGDVLAASRTVWIVLTEEQMAAFDVADRT